MWIRYALERFLINNRKLKKCLPIKNVISSMWSADSTSAMT